jgi:hypothetical protein
MCAMTAVELHGIWERYVEDRLVAGLNHDPSFFVADQGLTGVNNVSKGLAHFVVRGGQKYFDFRSMGDLTGRSNRFLGEQNNPFKNIPKSDREYINALAAVRNRVVRGSDASIAAYNAALLPTATSAVRFYAEAPSAASLNEFVRFAFGHKPLRPS